MRTRRLGVAVTVATAVLVFAACANSSSTTTSGGGSQSPSGPAQIETLKPGELQVASCLDYKPFEYYKGQQLLGFDIDITQAIADRLGLKVVWVKANFDTIFTALAANQFDMVAAASTITPEREQQVNFSSPYFNARQSLTVNITKTPDITSTDQLGSGDIVGVQKGSTGKAWAEKNLVPQGVQLKTFDLSPDSFTDLEAGNIVGVINDEAPSQAIIADRPDLKVVEGIDTGEHYGLAISKDNPSLQTAVDDALKAIIADGTYTTIFQKYFPGTDVPPEYQATG